MANSQETNVNLKINRVPDKATLEDMIANNQIQPNQLYMLPSELGSGVVTMQTKVLWTNSSPTSAFAAQTITVENMSEYQYIMVQIRHSTVTSINTSNIFFNEYGIDNGIYSSFIEDYICGRAAIIRTSTTIQFDTAYKGNNQTDSSLCIPLKIIGIKLIESPTQITNKYSTDETVVGEWIDGKKIYRKVFELSSEVEIHPQSWTSIGIKHTDYNVSKVISVKIINSSGTYYNASCALNIDDYFRFIAARDNSTIQAKYVILEYTKTTE